MAIWRKFLKISNQITPNKPFWWSEVRTHHRTHNITVYVACGGHSCREGKQLKDIYAERARQEQGKRNDLSNIPTTLEESEPTPQKTPPIQNETLTKVAEDVGMKRTSTH